jgi:Short C-terminal domain
MSDWIEQLERLTQLHKSGALTDAEFAGQKAKILAAQDQTATTPVLPEPPAMVPEPTWEPEPESASRSGVPKLLLFGLPVALLLAGAAWFGSTLVGGGPDPELSAAAASPAASDTADAAVAATEEAPKPVALDGTLAFAAANQCSAAPTLEQIYKKLDAAGELGSGRGMTVTLGGFELPLAITATTTTAKDGIENREASLRFPEGTTWQGLRLSRLTTRTTIVPESDGGYSRTVNFLDSPDKVQRTLARLGFGAPKEPAYAELTDEGCGGSMQISPVAGGSALICSWGC